MHKSPLRKNVTHLLKQRQKRQKRITWKVKYNSLRFKVFAQNSRFPDYNVHKSIFKYCFICKINVKKEI